ncbi:aspartate/glutamate racemase family protein [Mucilaginibacter psychrotolerans]|uniref:Amino acid racemase n=1 Tax=Mucilaginibacter psychrotolerans TaxID=1524096 RepID=A0A4Y8SL02_9SPHI|nr:amino acid racemase [Mucilaginibacter psychrotolerans]TFF39310.1 amino acid racemase [Mucilaginibacter psychrotolerans]
MKTLGLIGDTSWVSTIDYYRFINQGINDKFGGVNAARLLLHSFNYADIVKNLDTNNWEAILKMIVGAGTGLKNSGAEAIVFCGNTTHLVAAEAQQQIGLPIIHIAEAAAAAIKKQGIKTIALLGTRFTMEHHFFSDKLQTAGIAVLTPDKADRDFIHETLLREMGKGIFKPDTKAAYLRIIDKLKQQGAECVILGCTEIPLLIQPADTDMMLFDTAAIHSAVAVEFALA